MWLHITGSISVPIRNQSIADDINYPILHQRFFGPIYAERHCYKTLTNCLACLQYSPLHCSDTELKVFQAERWLTRLTQSKKRQVEHQEDGQVNMCRHC